MSLQNYRANDITGVVLAKVIEVDFSSDKYLKLTLEVSNFKVTSREITINLFQNSFNNGVSIKEMDTFFQANNECHTGQLFYCEIGVNAKGYYEMKNLLYLPKDNVIHFDPRHNHSENDDTLLEDLFL